MSTTTLTTAAPSLLDRVKGSRLLWPVIALVALLAANALSNPGFLSVRVQDGHLYGSLIDILGIGNAAEFSRCPISTRYLTLQL